MIKKSNKKNESSCSFWHHNADKYGYLGPFDKNHAQPKSGQEGEIFFDEFDFNVLFIHLRTWKCLLMPLFLLYAPN